MAQNITVTDNTSVTVTSKMLGTDGVKNNGTVTTTLSTTGEGAALRVRMQKSDGSSPPEDTASCAELLEYATDMQKHWEKVVEKLGGMASASGSGSGLGG